MRLGAISNRKVDLTSSEATRRRECKIKINCSGRLRLCAGGQHYFMGVTLLSPIALTILVAMDSCAMTVRVRVLFAEEPISLLLFCVENIHTHVYHARVMEWCVRMCEYYVVGAIVCSAEDNIRTESECLLWSNSLWV